jgi:RimJ/RimL family protein N-acetyltransferase
LRPGDLDDVAALFADPEQMRYYPNVRRRAEAVEWLDRNIEIYETHGFGAWCLELPDGSFAGYCGLRPLALEGDVEVEVAWHVAKAWWNRGLATEAAQLAIRLGFDEYGLARLVAIITPDNHPSRRVAEKLGMTEERTVVFEGEPVVLYATSPD